MDEAIKILREQAILCAHLPELFDELIKVMQSNSPEVQPIVDKIAPIIRDLNKNQQREQEFLRHVNALSLAAYLAMQEKSIQRDVAEKLLQKSADAQLQLKNRMAELKLLLRKGQEYVEFNLNILARTSASDTYGAQATTDSRRPRRMFEANV